MNNGDIKGLIFQQLTKRNMTTDVEVDYSQTAAGRGLFAKKHYELGDCVFEEYPVGGTAIPYFDRQAEFCSNCVRPLIDAHIECPNDCDERFCSLNCLEWATKLYHERLCSARTAAYKEYHSKAKESGNEYYIVAARMLVMFPSAPWLHHFDCPDWTQLDHTEKIEDLVEDTMMMARLLHGIVAQSSDDVDHTYRLLSATVGMLRVNVLGLKHEDDNLGFALYSQQSLMNHSNQPNCQCVTKSGDERRNNPGLCAIEVIRNVQPGDELTIDYLACTNEPERTRILRYQYGISE